MKIRGERQCTDCGATWSYYETGSVTCPDCGSLRSVGTEERKHHTDTPIELDLTAVRDAVDEKPLQEVAALASEVARAYVRERGFISGGHLRPLDETYVAAVELAYAAAAIERNPRLDDGDEEAFYLYELLRGADAGNRPPAGEVPSSLHHARGLATARAVGTYRRDATTWLDDETNPARGSLEILGEHEKRIEALDGEVDPAVADALGEAAKGIGMALREDDADALASARERLDRLRDA